MAWENSVTVCSGPTDAALTVSSGKPVGPASGVTIDGVSWTSLTVGTRVLLVNQGGSPGVAAVTNGVWLYEGAGMSMQRPASPDPYHGPTLDNETVTRVSSGTAYAHTEWACVTKGAITVGTTPIAH